MVFNGRQVGGEQHPTAKLPDTHRICIRLARGQVAAKSLARIYGVSERTIWDQWNKGLTDGVSEAAIKTVLG